MVGTFFSQLLSLFFPPPPSSICDMQSVRRSRSESARRRMPVATPPSTADTAVSVESVEEEEDEEEHDQEEPAEKTVDGKADSDDEGEHE